MAYQVEFEFSPMHELVISLCSFVNQTEHKTLDVGVEWVKAVRAGLQGHLAKRLASGAMRKYLSYGFMACFIMRAPDPHEVQAFLQWFSERSAGELYECLLQSGLDPADAQFGNLEERRDVWVDVLGGWYEGYFRNVNPQIIQGLFEEAARMKRLSATMPPEELVMTAMNGVQIQDDSIDRVILIPQYHYRPWNLTLQLGRNLLNYYPADVLPPAPGEPPKTLIRLTKALADESRLRMLRYIAAEGPHTFTDIVQNSGLSKGTVHHHLVALRAAGLIWLQTDMKDSRKYHVHAKTMDDISELVKRYVFDREV